MCTHALNSNMSHINNEYLFVFDNMRLNKLLNINLNFWKKLQKNLLLGKQISFALIMSCFLSDGIFSFG